MRQKTKAQLQKELDDATTREANVSRRLIDSQELLSDATRMLQSKRELVGAMTEEANVLRSRVEEARRASESECEGLKLALEWLCLKVHPNDPGAARRLQGEALQNGFSSTAEAKRFTGQG